MQCGESFDGSRVGLQMDKRVSQNGWGSPGLIR